MAPYNGGLLRATGISFAFLAIVPPILYVSYCETIRHAELRRRRERHERKRAARAIGRSKREYGVAEGAEDGTVEEDSLMEDVKEVEEAGEEEKQELRELYKSIRIGGRYANPFPEWKEQVGAWEWLVWKLFYQPYTGRFMWNGGTPSSAQELADSLPVEAPDFDLLFGQALDTEKRVASSSSGSNDGEKEALADSWDHLSQPALSDPNSLASSTEALASPFSTSSNPSQTPRRQVRVGRNTTLTWIGQSTSFVQLDGVGILTDPVFSHKTIDSFLAPPRLCPCPCTLASLLSIQVVLVSHSHLDHISPAVPLALGSSVEWVVPLGMRPWFRKLGVADDKIHDLDWWECVELELNVPGADGTGAKRKLSITSTAAMHWSARTPLDTNQSLWCSYVVKGDRDSYFHCGDTGYSAGLFKAIGRLFGPITFATLPIGAYAPRWHLAPVHMSPEDAVQAHKDIGSKFSVGVHHSTWCLSDEHYLAPPKDLAIAREKHGLGERDFCVVPQGRTIEI
ncbi:N-acyl-phosphatidylethanolamine-hydrolyzing phospholipase D, partial [Phenoliferia sp. Uapishka_3]